MMKLIFKMTLFASILIICSSKAQTTTDYINFYNTVVPKLKSITPGKTQFYGQNFLSFYNEMLSKNISPVGWIYDSKIKPSTKYYKLTLFFCDMGMLRIARENSFQHPWVTITFADEISSQVESLMTQQHSQWNLTTAQFFSNMKIEKIEFTGVKGYNVEDYSE
ncbi:hypothetical protein ODZ84_03195 [Chryseobacterium fluminis]|uniref:hypothetical protein n=1 Tax=Chryseobacterium fluminis TaxID=2983606 RepID=UPI00224E01ED|nr:hypothetical protein [Chryseobacterium sp. MMS21-Ot14]UZT98593.1 hypothetical protein ODZ84_03195 [Chryseobacterium sp. MMS21-Ot14]